MGAARRIGDALTVVLILVAGITLFISGIFIMNIMLVSVIERTSEIGVRMAVGASRRHIQQQFLIEACAISALGGLAGPVLDFRHLAHCLGVHSGASLDYRARSCLAARL